MNDIKYKNIISCLLIILIFYFLMIDMLLCLTPPVARDALIHHLAVPKLWIHHGGFYEMPWAEYSYYPMNIDLLYLIPLYFGYDFVPAFVQLIFGWGTAAMIYGYLRWRISRIAGLLGILIFLSTPVISKLSTMAYVDLGLVFFTTAAALSFLRWRSGDYHENKWLVISAVSMGLALGTKYNALVLWFFMTLAVVFMVSRDTGKSGMACKSGLIFFILSLILFSPWLIKNAVLTGNPLYPLFPGLFGIHGESPSGSDAVAFVNHQAGLFRTREMMFGESLWEILLIPVRMFFQGQDHSPRYFDGVLNPLLILFAPVAFIKKDWKSDKLYFLLFSIFILLIAFFLNQIRIRYILPAIPFLVILSVTGMMNAFGWLSVQKRLLQKIGITALLAVILILVSMNVIYIQKYFFNIAPIRYILNEESRDDFIARHDESYPAMMYINRTTPEDSRIRLILLAGRGYHLNREYQEDRSRGMGIGEIHKMLLFSGSPEAFRKYLSSLNCTHLLIRYDLLKTYLKDGFDPQKVQQLEQQMKLTLKKTYDDGRYAVFEVRNT